MRIWCSQSLGTQAYMKASWQNQTTQSHCEMVVTVEKEGKYLSFYFSTVQSHASVCYLVNLAKSLLIDLFSYLLLHENVVMNFTA